MWRQLVSFRSLLATAVLAAMFSAVVGGGLLWQFWPRPTLEVVQSAELLQARAELRVTPGDAHLQARVRELDRDVRHAFFRRQRFARRGALLLLAGAALTLGAATGAAALRPSQRLPRTVPQRPDYDTSLARLAVPAVFLVSGLLVVGSAALYRATPRVLPERSQLASAAAPAAHRTSPVVPAAVTPATFLTAEQRALHWPRFRGAYGAGHADSATPPVQWNVPSGEGLRWKTAVPQPGNSSPIVWNNRVFVSGASRDQQEVYCFDANDGRLMWTSSLGPSPAGMPAVSEETGYAAPTMATDGQCVFVVFASGDLAAINFAGQTQWQISLGPLQNSYGHASSLEVFQDRLIVQLDQGPNADALSRLLAIRTADGSTAWQTSRDVPNSWSSPIVIEHQQHPQVITTADPWVIAYDPFDGAEIWRARCLRQDVGPSPAYAEGLVVVASEFPGVSAISVDGRGDVSKSHVRWTSEFGAPDTCSPLIVRGMVLVLASYGTLTCYDVGSGGEPLWEEDFDDTFRASPSCAGELTYLFGESGKAWVVRPTPTGCERVSESDLGEACVASPAFLNSRLFVRGQENLYCLERR